MKKIDRIEINLDPELSNLFTKYCKQNGTNKTKVISSLIENLRNRVEKQVHKNTIFYNELPNSNEEAIENLIKVLQEELVNARAQKVETFTKSD
ncbi:hypothetical protein [Gottfriedia acidiceleris]|uniref:hypothetical protein n=1 Tax=Gottfriedia acidiceleris TaxID=371036 RepID=UPI003D1CF77A